MKVLDKYRLELRWDKVEKNTDKICLLKGAHFCGPVLKDAREIDSNDRMVLDFTPQYSRIITHHYFATLCWGEVKYNDDKVILEDALLDGDFVNDVSNLKDTDYILIDTSKHEEEIHMYNLVYKSIVKNKDERKYEDG
jgi:hypothetical protein